MKFLKKLFSGKSPEVRELDGDRLFASQSWGQAKLAFEKALEKLERLPDRDNARYLAMKSRLEQKRTNAMESLARRHFEEAVELIESGYFDDAMELVLLALELTTAPELQQALKQKREEIEQGRQRELELSQREYEFESHDPDEEGEEEQFFPQVTEDEQFQALCATLPDDIQGQYLKYGYNFKIGYLALNEGDFPKAAEHLGRAMEENLSPRSYIPMELATAYLNLERTEEARQLMEKFLANHPEALPAYQLMCEILWELKDFKAIWGLLDNLPEDRARTVPVYILKGETLFREGKIQEAREYYLDFLNTHGWNETIARSLALCHESLDELNEARNLYGEMINRCSGCGARVDPHVKKRFADLSFHMGDLSSKILELYLSIALELPELAPDCHDKVSRIYLARGDKIQAGRFKALSDQAKGKS